jgi:hypothetical protein
MNILLFYIFSLLILIISADKAEINENGEIKLNKVELPILPYDYTALEPFIGIEEYYLFLYLSISNITLYISISIKVNKHYIFIMINIMLNMSQPHYQ